MPDEETQAAPLVFTADTPVSAPTYDVHTPLLAALDAIGAIRNGLTNAGPVDGSTPDYAALFATARAAIAEAAKRYGV